jgi:hypothetical protein
MFVQKVTGFAAAAAVAAFMSAGPTQASMYPATHYGAPNVHHVDCAVGFHIGPLGTCVVGVDDRPPPREPPPDRIIEHRSVDEGGCETKSVHRTDAVGNSETRTKTNCD